MKDFRFSFAVTIVGLALAAFWGHRNGMGAISAVTLAAVLSIMEVSLSFDNAVVNAAVLRDMSHKWQTIFLTVGILIAVFGMRLLFPIVIVAVATGLGMGEVAALALSDPNTYSRHLTEHYPAIAAFGGMFLLLVFLSFLFDEKRELFWLGRLEARLARLGRMPALAVMLALAALLFLYFRLPLALAEKATVLAAGLGGVLLFMAVSGIDLWFGEETGQQVKRNGAAAFLYLEVLDASFSFDGVIGAFAITRDMVVIMLGLGIGAMFVRSLTIHLVRRGTLEQYVFLEHGAHYAIGALAFLMLYGIARHVSEILTGLVGMAFIVASLISSIRHNRRMSVKK
ncbi:MAG: DUF475 domain-containing protein [Zoogloeaceae bacterium]|jgi:hypothetical protein|nr:DUF475 domain-containing protein [Zoogloeaceae bacterium]